MATKTTARKIVKTTKNEENGSNGEDVKNETAVETVVAPKSEKKESTKTPPNAALLDLAELKDMSISELTHVAKEMGVEGASGMRKHPINHSRPAGAGAWPI